MINLSSFNAGVEDAFSKNFCYSYNLICRSNKPTCLKTQDKPSCMDLILTNCPGSLQNSCPIETYLSEFS